MKRQELHKNARFLAIRTALGCTQEDMAELVHTNSRTYRRWENGNGKNIPGPGLVALEATLLLHEHDLLDELHARLKEQIKCKFNS